MLYWSLSRKGQFVRRISYFIVYAFSLYVYKYDILLYLNSNCNANQIALQEQYNVEAHTKHLEIFPVLC